MRVAAIIPAAGSSSRMGTRNKLSLPFNGSTVLQSTLNAVARSRVSQVIAVLGYQSDYWLPRLREPGVEIVVHEQWQRGMAGSIIAGLGAIPCDSDAVMIIPADMPLLEPALINQLIDQAGGGEIIAPRFNGRRGHPVLFPIDLLSQMREVPADANGLRAVIERQRERLRVIDTDDEAVVLDIDDEEAYLHLSNLQRWRDSHVGRLA